MKFIQGHNRNQINLFPVSLDESIDPGNKLVYYVFDVNNDHSAVKETIPGGANQIYFQI